MSSACAPSPTLVEEATRSAPALWFGGDVHLGVAPRGGVEDIRAMVGDAVGVVNLEGPVAVGAGGAVTDNTGITLTNPEGAGAFLAGQGIVAVSFVNNHADDLGPEGRARTLATLAAAGVAVAAPIAHFGVGTKQVTLLSYTVEGADLPALSADVRAATDVSVVSLHVTGPPSYLPTPALRAAVDAVVSAGADIVVAHGTHAIGPVERRGNAVIAWGLGNLLFDCDCTDGADALVLRVELGTELLAEILPVRAGMYGAPARVPPDDGILDLVDAISPTRVARRGVWGTF